MKAEEFANALGCDFFVGVPDSKLRALCDHLMDRYGTDPQHHVIAANEGGCTAIAAGYHLATGRVPVVYMQNSGIGNAINPIVSLLSDRVYGIPVLFVVGWRGEPGIKDEPQHIYQGEITRRLLEDVGSYVRVLDAETTRAELSDMMRDIRRVLEQGRSAAFVVREGALEHAKHKYANGSTMLREEAIKIILEHSGDDIIISTTGKASREVFTLREEARQGHGRDLLTVGSMGHSSSIALGVALQAPDKRVWCIDGDGAVIMHMGALAVIGAAAPKNLIHAVINNEAHESVGGMPTVAGKVDLCGVARACGYDLVASVSDADGVRRVLREALRERRLCFIEMRCAIGARKDLGRPTLKPSEMKNICGAL